MDLAKQLIFFGPPVDGHILIVYSPVLRQNQCQPSTLDALQHFTQYLGRHILLHSALVLAFKDMVIDVYENQLEDMRRKQLLRLQMDLNFLSCVSDNLCQRNLVTAIVGFNG